MANNLEYFLAIVNSSSFTKAAEELSVSQPALTQFISRLEKKHDSIFFERSSNGLKLTDAGRVYEKFVRVSLELEQTLASELSALKENVSGLLKLGFPMQLQNIVAHRILLPFYREFPNIKVDTDGSASHMVEKNVSTGNLDCGIVFTQGARYSGVYYTVLTNQRVPLVCSNMHPLVRGRESSIDDPIPVSLSDLKDYIFILEDSQENFLRRVTESFFRKHSFEPRRVITVPNINAMLNIAITDDAFTFVPEGFIADFKDFDQLAFLKPENDSIQIDLSFINPKKAAPSNALFSFLRCLRKVYDI